MSWVIIAVVWLALIGALVLFNPCPLCMSHIGAVTIVVTHKAVARAAQRRHSMRSRKA